MADFRKHHYVPKFYLEGFVDPIDPRFLWVVDIEQKEIRKENPKNTAKVSGFYDLYGTFTPDKLAIEKGLGELESAVAPIIRKLRRKPVQLSLLERFRLACFIGIQIGRVPIFREHLDRNLEPSLEAWSKEIARTHKKFQGELSEIAQRTKESILSGRLKLGLKFNEEFDRKNFLTLASIEAGIRFGSVIFSMHWVFLVTNGNSSFFASDNPARIMSPNAKPLEINFEGKNEFLEFSFPISPSCVLWIHGRHIQHGTNVAPIEIQEIKSDFVNRLNWAILPTIHKYAYCSTKQQAEWILKQISET